MEESEDVGSLLHTLRERVKELAALHRTARMLQDDVRPISLVLSEVVESLPAAWQHPEIAAACIRFGAHAWATPNFAAGPWSQVASFIVRDGRQGSVEVVYLEDRPLACEGPFLAEERSLIDSLAEMVRAYLQNKLNKEALQQARDSLESLVAERTRELRTANASLGEKVHELTRARREVDSYQHRLRQMTAELSLAEERERRAIAADLHDHAGQALAYIKMKLLGLRGDAVFCGFDDSLGEVLDLLNQTIAYVRTLTAAISPPVLYAFGLPAALEWLAESSRKKYGLTIRLLVDDAVAAPSEAAKVLLFRSAQELLVNVAKHAQAPSVMVMLQDEGGRLCLSVCDEGRGFDPAVVEQGAGGVGGGFGLFSIRERLSVLGGAMEVRSAPGQGTCVRLTLPAGGKDAPEHHPHSDQ